MWPGKAVNGQRQNANVQKRDGQPAEHGGDFFTLQPLFAAHHHHNSQHIANAAAQRKAKRLCKIKILYES